MDAAMGKETINVDYFVQIASGRINEMRTQAKEAA
jgi:hypothetical protein